MKIPLCTKRLGHFLGNLTGKSWAIIQLNGAEEAKLGDYVSWERINDC